MDVKNTTTCENILNQPDYLEPSKKIETVEKLEIPKITEYCEEIPDRKLMYDRKLKYEFQLMNNVNNKADTHYLKPLPLSQIPKPKVPKVDATKNKYQPNWLITIVLSSITAILSIHL